MTTTSALRAVRGEVEMAMTSKRGSGFRALAVAGAALLSSLGVHCGGAEHSMHEPLNPVIVIFAPGLEVSASRSSFALRAAGGSAAFADAASLGSAADELNARVAREKVLRIATVFPEGTPSAEHAEEMTRIWSITLDPASAAGAAEALAADLAASSLVERAYVQPTPYDASGGAEPGPPTR